MVILVGLCCLVGFGLAVTALWQPDSEDSALVLAESRQDATSALDWFEAEVRRELRSSEEPGAASLDGIQQRSHFLASEPRRYSLFPRVVLWIDGWSSPDADDSWIEMVAASDFGSTQGCQLRRRIYLSSPPLSEATIWAERDDCTSCHRSIVGPPARILSEADTAGDTQEAGCRRSTSTPRDDSGRELGRDRSGDRGRALRRLGLMIDDSVSNGLITWSEKSVSGVSDTRLPSSGIDASKPMIGAFRFGSSNVEELKRFEESFAGNLVLIGTEATPLRIEGTVRVEGDVVVKGVFVGAGTLIAGRNLYVAGNVSAATHAGMRSSLNLVARQDIVIGDWTHRDSHGEIARQRDRQGQLFIASALQLAEGSDSDAPFIEDADYDRYDRRIAPGSPGRDGTFQPWMSQNDYREIRGESVVYDLPWYARFDSRPAIAYELQTHRRQTNEIWRLRPGSTWFDPAFFGQLGWGLAVTRVDRERFLVVETGPVRVTTPIDRIDALLLAGQSIVGRTSAVSPLHVYGAMVAPEIHVKSSSGGRPRDWVSPSGFSQTLRWHTAGPKTADPNANHPKSAAPSELRVVFDARLRQVRPSWLVSLEDAGSLRADTWESHSMAEVTERLHQLFGANSDPRSSGSQLPAK